MADVLSLALDKVLTARFGPAAEDGRAVHTAEDGRTVHTAEDGRAVHTPSGTELLPSVPLLRAVAELAAGTGAGETFEFLLGRQLDANPRQYTLTPPELAELMAALVEAGSGPPARSSTRPRAPAPCCAPSPAPPPCTPRRPTPTSPRSPR